MDVSHTARFNTYHPLQSPGSCGVPHHPCKPSLETNPGSFPAQPGQSILSNRNVRRMVHGDYLHVSLWQSIQNADGLKPIQRYEFYNNPVEHLRKCATVLALEPSMHLRSSSPCDCCLNPSNLLAIAPLVFFDHVIGRTRSVNYQLSIFVLQRRNPVVQPLLF